MNDGQKEQLVALYAKGWSFGEIANEVGCSRNAAIGAAHRMELPPRKVKKASPVRKVAQAPKVKPAPKPVEVPVPDKDYRCRIEALTNETCRFPMWAYDAVPYTDKFYCGAPGADSSGGKPYCTKHTRLCNPNA